MMMKLKKEFHITENKIETEKQKAKKIDTKLFQERDEITLKRYTDVLFISEPFRWFMGDCMYCTKYIDSHRFAAGGYCKLHKISCGSGFTCCDNDSSEIKNWKGFGIIMEEKG